MRTRARIIVLTSLLCAGAQAASAQQPTPPPPPPPPWTGSFGFGLTLTQGNTDMANVNLSFDAKYAPAGPDSFKAEGLYLRGATNGVDTADRLGLQARVEHLVGKRAFVFGQGQYLRDPFKGIDYLVSPTAGAGYKIVDTPAVQFAADTSVGAVWEKNPGMDVEIAPAWTAGEKLTYKLSAAATFTQGAQALWKLDDFDNALYTFNVGLASAVTTRTQLKAELLDTYKTSPPAGNQSNDVSLILSLVFKY